MMAVSKKVSNLPTPNSPGARIAGFTGLAGVLAASAAGQAQARTSDGLKAQAEALKAAMAARAEATRAQAPTLSDNYERAKLQLASGDVTGAMASFRRALAEAPDSVDAMNGLAVSYDRMGRHDVARGWYEAALAIAPENAPLLSNLGYSLVLQGKDREAIPFLQAATRTGDATATATAQRLLSRISARLTAATATAAMQAVPAEIALSSLPANAELALADLPRASAAPAPLQTAQLALRPRLPAATNARVETASDGEAMLVVGGAVPLPAVVATLGDMAALTMVPRRWTEADDARVSQQLAEAESARAQAVSAPVHIEAPRAYLAFVKMPPRATGPVSVAAEPLVASIETATLIKAALPRRAVALLRRAAAPAPAPRLVAAASMLVMLPAPPLAAAGLGDAVVLPAQHLVAMPAVAASQSWARGEDPNMVPAWLFSQRRVGDGRQQQDTPGPMVAANDSVRLFECDDSELNSFAARFSGHATDEIAAAKQAAVARLEALVARLHRA